MYNYRIAPETANGENNNTNKIKLTKKVLTAIAGNLLRKTSVSLLQAIKLNINAFYY